MSFLQLSAAQKLAPSAASMPQGSACCVPCCRLLACSSVAACLVLGVAARIAIDLTNLARGMHRATESVAAQAQAYAGRSNSGAPDAIVFSIGDEKGEARRAYSRLLILRSGTDVVIPPWFQEKVREFSEQVRGMQCNLSFSWSCFTLQNCHGTFGVASRQMPSTLLVFKFSPNFCYVVRTEQKLARVRKSLGDAYTQIEARSCCGHCTLTLSSSQTFNRSMHETSNSALVRCIRPIPHSQAWSVVQVPLLHAITRTVDRIFDVLREWESKQKPGARRAGSVNQPPSAKPTPAAHPTFAPAPMLMQQSAMMMQQSTVVMQNASGMVGQQQMTMMQQSAMEIKQLQQQFAGDRKSVV